MAGEDARLGEPLSTPRPAGFLCRSPFEYVHIQANGDVYPCCPSKFGQVIDYIKKHPKQISLKDQKGKLILICEDIKSIDQARQVLMEMTQ